MSGREQYEEKLVSRIEDRRVGIHDSLGAREGDRLSCQNDAIDQNIDIMARGRLVPHHGNLTINDLSTNHYYNKISGTGKKNDDGIIYYNFDSKG